MKNEKQIREKVRKRVGEKLCLTRWFEFGKMRLTGLNQSITKNDKITNISKT